MNIEATKLELIKLIADAQSERLLEQVWTFFKQAAIKQNKSSANSANTAATPNPIFSNGNGKSELLALSGEATPLSLDIEQLKSEQGYDTIQMFEHFRTLDRKAWEDENVEELLELLRL